MGGFFGPGVMLASSGFFGGASGGADTWTQLVTGFEGPGHPAVFDLSFANTNWLISAAGTNVITSPDTVTWTQTFVSGFTTVGGAAFGAGLYVLVIASSAGVVHIFTSPDLVTWTSTPSGYPAVIGNRFIFDPVFGNGTFLTCSSHSTNYTTSPDGLTWTLQSAYVPNVWGQPIFDGTQFVASVLNASDLPKVVTSLDGIHWTESTATLTADFNVGSTPFYIGNRGTAQYIVGESNDDVGNSLNGALSSVSPFSFNDGGQGTLVRPIYSGTSWARLSNDLVSSTDGMTWFSDTIPAGFVQGVALTFGSGKFLALGRDASSHLFMITRGP